MGEPHALELRQDTTSYDYNILGDDVDLDELFASFCISLAIRPFDNEVNDNVSKTYCVDALSRMVYTSNSIDNAGGFHGVTRRLCKRILAGQDPHDITARDAEYHTLRVDLQHMGLPTGLATIRRAYRETVQHIEAALYIFDEVANPEHFKDLTEDIILNTHLLLNYKVDCPEYGMEWFAHAGTYRTESEANYIASPAPSQVPRLVSEMITELNADIAQATEDGALDPVALAAKYCHKFVAIQPFLNGNGRMSRLILNALLLKYSNVIVDFGEDEEERNEYLWIEASGSIREFMGPDPKRWKALASFTLAQAMKREPQISQVPKKA